MREFGQIWGRSNSPLYALTPIVTCCLVPETLLSPRQTYKLETANSSRVSGFFMPCVPKVFDFPIFDADRYYCIDFANKVILDMEHEGLDVSRLKKQQTQQEITPVQSVQPIQKPNIIQGIRKVLQQSGGSEDANREHEVGSHGNYDDIDDERHLKR